MRLRGLSIKGTTVQNDKPVLILLLWDHIILIPVVLNLDYICEPSRKLLKNADAQAPLQTNEIIISGDEAKASFFLSGKQD